MLTDAFATLSPQLAVRYQAVLTRALVDSPELTFLHEYYLDYTRLDTKLPRPVLAYFGYHAPPKMSVSAILTPSVMGY